ncbi:hypothetical protein AWB75_05700 [Caballeronia catudaia]|uniref:Lipoprotein n=1 Tax=Caballeronia catudaia TaxID=1777136 RepID=A0A158CSZ2_9BURK|nr:hypothetical protein AWB75_05700 [Caballeronia catudaia]
MISKNMIAFALCVISVTSFARGGGYSGGHSSYHSSGTGEHYVNGYTRSNGTYVAGHHQTNPNGTKYDNWSSKGNVNPYTGKEGTVDPSR